MLMALDVTIFVLFCAVVLGVSMFKGAGKRGAKRSIFWPDMGCRGG